MLTDRYALITGAAGGLGRALGVRLERDGWCLCAALWLEALKAGVAPPLVLRATHVRALQTVDLDMLKRHALDLI